MLDPDASPAKPERWATLRGVWPRIRWFNVAVLVLTPAAGIYGAFYTPLHRSTLLFSAFYYFFSMLGTRLLFPIKLDPDTKCNRVQASQRATIGSSPTDPTPPPSPCGSPFSSQAPRPSKDHVSGGLAHTACIIGIPTRQRTHMLSPKACCTRTLDGC